MLPSDLIRLHTALMYDHLFRPYYGHPLDLRLAYDIIQIAHDFQAELTYFVGELGNPDLSDDQLSTQFDESMDDNMADIHNEIDRTRALMRTVETEHPDIDPMQIVRDLSH